MNGQKRARIKRCRRCEYVIWRGEGHAGPEGFRRFCTGAVGPAQKLNDAFMEGPDGNCPKGYWAGLEPEGPLDEAEFQQWAVEKEREKLRQSDKPRLKKLLASIAASEPIPVNKRTALAVLVAAGCVEEWLADEIMAEL